MTGTAFHTTSRGYATAGILPLLATPCQAQCDVIQGLAKLHILIARLLLTHTGGRNPRFSSPAYVENIYFDGFSLTYKESKNQPG
jgi:hypothetical protein